jgi:hypothetical protein
MKEAKIYVIHYKKGTVLKNDGLYTPLMCGTFEGKDQLGYLTDDTGDHLSDKNSIYSELSGLYWVWKNTSQPVTGTCHYRRFFTAQPEPLLYQLKRWLFYPAFQYKKRFGLIYTQDVALFKDRILTAEELVEILTDHDGILPQARMLRYSVQEHYRRYHDLKDLEILRSILQEKYPDYLEAYEAMLSGNRLYANNMFILKDEFYQPFMAWWFDMIFEFEKRVNYSDYTGYQQRIIGFLGERLLTTWFKKHQLQIKELQLIYFKKFKEE